VDSSSGNLSRSASQREKDKQKGDDTAGIFVSFRDEVYAWYVAQRPAKGSAKGATADQLNEYEDAREEFSDYLTDKYM
jgi:hypothetical protein